MALSVPAGGLIGWRFLQRTMDRQVETIAAQPLAVRELQHLREALPKAATVDDFLGDRMLTRSVLTAFGLESERNKTALLRKILVEGTESPQAMARRMADRRFENFARALGYGNSGGAQVGQAGLADKIAGDYVARRVELAASETDPALRLALNFKREIAAVAQSPGAAQAGWYQVMGNQPLRQVIEAAFGLPSQSAQLDLEDQKRLFERKAQNMFGEPTVGAFLEPANVNRAIEIYLLRDGATRPPAAPILQLFQSSPAISPLSLLLSRGQI